jgi:predicted TIM-barrel fold metal-dependent hydrolase
MDRLDAHLHCTGRETADDVLRALDEARVEHGVLLAPMFAAGWQLGDADLLARGNRHLARLVNGHADRLSGFAVVHPLHASAADALQRAVDAGLVGLKTVPSGWFPGDDAVQPLFERASALRLPVLLHTGIFIDGRSSRFCRPADCEPLRAHAGLRVTLAHLSWPWTDEALAVGLIDRIHGIADDDAFFRFDLSFGAPPPYRHALLRRALDVLGPGLLQFGSDCFLPCAGAELRDRQNTLEALMDELALDEPTRARLWGGTARAWLAPRP